jgi:spoIIIJ-associated protein
MDFVEVEGKTYEEAIRKACAELNAEEKDLDIDVKEVDTKGILGLLGSKKVRITARLREKEITPEEYGQKFLQEVGAFLGLSFETKVSQYEDRVIFLVQSDDGDVLIGKDGETLEGLQHLLRLAIAKRYKQGLKVLVDINGYRDKRKTDLTIMARKLANKARRTGQRIKTEPLNPYERRIVHSVFKHNKNITTKSEGEGHTKQVVISPVGDTNDRR